MTETRTSEGEERLRFCNKCGYLGTQAEHGGCSYLAYVVPDYRALLTEALEIAKEATDALDAGVHRAQLVLRWTALRAKLSDTEEAG